MGASLLLASERAFAQTRKPASDPFVNIEREGQASRRAEARDRAEALEQASERVRERERTRLTVDEDEDEHSDADLAGDE